MKLICDACKRANAEDWICQHAIEPEWRSMTDSDIGKLGRFCNRESDDWVYGRLVGIVDGVFMCQYMENDKPEAFFYGEIHCD